jgi:phenylalanyl-tRNA synthetase beta chain
MDLSALFAVPEKPIQYSRLPKYPSVVRDLTLLVGRDVTFAALIKAVRDQNVVDCRDVNLVGTYDGANIPPGKRSITLRISIVLTTAAARRRSGKRHAALTAALWTLSWP